MSLLPYLLEDPFFYRPSRVVGQHFGLPLLDEDLLQPLTIPRSHFRCPAGYLRNWESQLARNDTGSTVSFDKDKFQANLDVQQFKPDEITVKVTGDRTISIEGKHEEKQDDHGYVSRHFVRRYVLPNTCDINRVESKLSSDGVLTITAPTTDQNAVEHKQIPIQQTGTPAKAIEKGAGDKKK